MRKQRKSKKKKKTIHAYVLRIWVDWTLLSNVSHDVPLFGILLQQMSLLAEQHLSLMSPLQKHTTCIFRNVKTVYINPIACVRK